jgi:hypothetical protein
MSIVDSLLGRIRSREAEAAAAERAKAATYAALMCRLAESGTLTKVEQGRLDQLVLDQRLTTADVERDLELAARINHQRKALDLLDARKATLDQAEAERTQFLAWRQEQHAAMQARGEQVMGAWGQASDEMNESLQAKRILGELLVGTRFTELQPEHDPSTAG